MELEWQFYEIWTNDWILQSLKWSEDNKFANNCSVISVWNEDLVSIAPGFPIANHFALESQGGIQLNYTPQFKSAFNWSLEMF